jgi:hypothetical protein
VNEEQYGEGSLNQPKNSSGQNHDSKVIKNRSKQQPPRPSTAQLAAASKDIFSSRKQSMDYVTVEGVKLRTGYHDKRDWYILVIKELLDNSIDFLWKKYQGAADAAIDVRIEKTNDLMFHGKVRNTNPKSFSVFEDLGATFNYDMRYGSKQNLHIISRGMLGDAMKQILALPYVLIHTKDDGTAFTDEQWEKPLIIRCNKKERHIFLHVNRANETIDAEIIPIDKELPYTDTEVEFTLPIIDEVAHSLDIRQDVVRFCREYPIFTTDISFKFRLIDYSPDTTTAVEAENEGEKNEEELRTLSSLSAEDKTKLASELVKVLSSPARKAPIKIDYPALHPISKNWVNIASIHSYKPTEFMTFIESVYDKENTSLDDRLRQLREGTQSKGLTSNKISIREFLEDANKDKKIENLFYNLRKVLDPPDKLSLPYTTNIGKRKEALTKRIARLYDGKLDTKSAVYKLEYGEYKDNDYGILHFPFVFEIIAIPFSNDVIDKEQVKSEFKGSVNYSVSPRGNIFEGNYQWDDDKSNEYYGPSADDIKGILSVYNFKFYVYSDSKVKLPSVIFANLVSQRIDYHGHEKSRIDTEPFKSTIIAAVRRLADDAKTFRAGGWTFEKPRSIGSSRSYYTPPVKEKKQSIREAFRQFLVKERGLPDVGGSGGE